MSKVSQVAQRIRSLPEIGVELGRITIARRVSQDVNDAVSRLAKVVSQAPYIDELTSGGMVAAVNEAVSFSVAQAKSLKKLVQRANFGSEKKISEHLDNILNKKQVVEKKRTELWGKVQAKVIPVETILRIAETAGLDSVERLGLAVATYKQATTSPPSSEADKNKVKAADELSKTAIVNSGLTGNVKTILDGAINANGDPRLLLEADVQQFLKDHPALWGALKLKLA